MNIECDGATLAELEGIFRFNDAVLRHLTVRRQEAVVEQSVMLKAKEEKDRSSRSYDDRDRDSGEDDASDDDSDDDSNDESDAESGDDDDAKEKRAAAADESNEAADADRADA
jgi:small subunit ribosomal protein S6